MPAEVDRAVYAKTPAWHRFGEVKNTFFTGAEAVASLDPSGEGVIRGEVSIDFTDSKGQKHRLVVDSKAGFVDYDNANGTWRYQSIMDKDYGLVQLDELISFLDAVVGITDGAHYDAAVKLRNGTQTVLSVYLGDYVLDPKGVADRGKRFIWGFNSTNGTWRLRVKKGDFRVECANMAAMALRGSTDQIVTGDWSTNHTKNVLNRVEEAKEALQVWNRHDRLFQAQAEHMLFTPIDTGRVDKIVTGLYTDINPKTGMSEADKQAVEVVMTNYEIGKNTEKITGTVWGALNAVTEYEDWMAKVKGTKSGLAEARLVKQLQDPEGRKQKAHDVFWEFAEEARKFKMPDLA